VRKTTLLVIPEEHKTKFGFTVDLKLCSSLDQQRPTAVSLQNKFYAYNYFKILQSTSFLIGYKIKGPFIISAYFFLNFQLKKFKAY
jgi:hypothetical protein